MKENKRGPSISGLVLLIISLISIAILKHTYMANGNWYWLLVLILPVGVFYVRKMLEKKHT